MLSTTFTVIVVPADPARPCRIVSVRRGDRGFRQVSELVGGAVEEAVYDRDALLYLNDSGRMLGFPVNERITQYVRNDSEAAEQHRQRHSPWPDDYVLCGDVVLAGSFAQASDRAWAGDACDVPERFYRAFGVPR